MARTKSDMLREHREVEKSRTIEEDNIIKKQKEIIILEDKKSPFPFTRKVDTDETSGLIKVSALGDDRNLIDHGIKDVNYHYSVNDAMYLSTWIRNQYLEPVKSTSIRKEDKGAFFIENTSDILLPEPYHQDNFVVSLANDISRITGTGSFEGRHKWLNMPKTITIPVLSPGHWRSVIVTIDYNEQIGGIYKVNILFDDPFGQGKFPSALKKLYSGIIERQVEKLIQIENEITHRPILNITEEDREGDQQGRGENGWDCGPIIFSNIEDLIKYHQPENYEEYYCQYSVPEYSSEGNQATILSNIRLRDIGRYNETAGAPIDEIRIKVIKEQLSKSRASKLENIKKSGFEKSITGMSDWDAVYIDMFFSVLDNKRVVEGIITATTPYTQDEVNYAYQLVLLKKHAKDQDNETMGEVTRKLSLNNVLQDKEFLDNLPEIITKLLQRPMISFEIILDNYYETFKSTKINCDEMLVSIFLSALIYKDIHALETFSSIKKFKNILETHTHVIAEMLVKLRILGEKTVNNKKLLKFLEQQQLKFIEVGDKISFIYYENDKKGLINKNLSFSVSEKKRIDNEKDCAQGQVNFFKACFSKVDNKAFFMKAIISFKKYLNTHEIDEELVQQTIEDFIMINNCFRNEDSTKLEKYIIDLVAKCPKYNKKDLIYTYIDFITPNRHILNFVQALEYAKLAYQYYKIYDEMHLITFTLEERLIIIKNMSECIKPYNPKKALEYLTEAYEISPASIDGDIIRVYIELGDFESAIRHTQKIHDIELQNLYTIFCYTNFDKLPPTELLNKFDFKNFSTVSFDSKKSEKFFVFHKIIDMFKIRDIKEGTLEIRDVESINKDSHVESIFDITHFTVQKLILCLNSKDKWIFGLQIIEDFYHQYPMAKNHNYLILNYLEFRFYLYNGLYEKALIELNILETMHSLGSKALFLAQNAQKLYVISQIEKKNYDTAKIYLSDKLIGRDVEKQKLINLIEILLKKNSEVQDEKGSCSAKNVKELTAPKTIYSLIEWNVTLEELSEACKDPKMIHAYFQEQKQKLNIINVNQVPPKIPLAWNIKGKINDSNSMDIFEIDNKPGFYATISKTIMTKLDTSTLAQFTCAIKKGLATKSLGQNGIKILENNLIELKILEDIRLFTQIIYKNEDEKYLIIFNHMGNHAAVKKLLSKKTQIEIIEVSSKSDLPAIETDENIYSPPLEDYDISLSGTDDSNFSDEI